MFKRLVLLALLAMLSGTLGLTVSRTSNLDVFTASGVGTGGTGTYG